MEHVGLELITHHPHLDRPFYGGHWLLPNCSDETPLLFWGESLAEYQSFYSYDEMEEVDEKRFNRAMNLGITADDMYEFLDGRVAKRDLYPFVYPPRKELMRIKCRSICLGSYIKWDTKKHVEIIKRDLPQARIVTATDLLGEARYQKSEAEIEFLRKVSTTD